MYVLDSCICIDIMRGKLPLAYNIMRQCDPKQFTIPAIVVAELYFGAEKSADSEKARMLTERFLAPFPIAPFDALCARAYGRVRNQLRLDGKPIGPNDMLIAATAIALQATLVSGNMHEFQRVKGLRLENWYESSLDAYITPGAAPL